MLYNTVLNTILPLYSTCYLTQYSTTTHRRTSAWRRPGWGAGPSRARRLWGTPGPCAAGGRRSASSGRPGRSRSCRCAARRRRRPHPPGAGRSHWLVEGSPPPRCCLWRPSTSDLGGGRGGSVSQMSPPIRSYDKAFSSIPMFLWLHFWELRKQVFVDIGARAVDKLG